MPRAVSNGGREEEIFAGLEEDALAWDTGLSQFLGKLEEELIRWHSEERSKAKDRQTKCQRAQKDLATAEASIREAVAPRGSTGLEDQPWQDKLKDLVGQAKEQRDEVRQVIELIRSHTKLHLEPVGGVALLQKLPSEGQPLVSSAEELPKLLKLFLDLAEKQPAEAPAEGRHRRGEGAGKATKDGDKKKRKGVEKKAKKCKAEKGRKAVRPMRSADASLDSEWSSSRSPSLSDRRRDRRGRHRRYTPSMDSRSFSDSRSPSRSQSRAPVRRRPQPCRPRRPGGHPGRGGGGGGRFGGGGGGHRRGDDIDVAKEIDRFCHVNKLEGRCEKIMRDLSPALARQVMGFSGGSNTFELSGDIRDPTAVVLARVRKAREDRMRGGGTGPPTRRRSPRGGQGRPRSISSRSRSRSRSPGGRGPPGGRRGGGQQTGSNAIPLGKPREFAPKPEEDREI